MPDETPSGRFCSVCLGVVVHEPGCHNAQHDPLSMGLSRPQGLTDRHIQVFDLLMQGMTTREISDALGIEDKTVKAHVSMILMRGRADSRHRLMAKYYRGEYNKRNGGEHVGHNQAHR